MAVLTEKMAYTVAYDSWLYNVVQNNQMPWCPYPSVCFYIQHWRWTLKDDLFKWPPTKLLWMMKKKVVIKILNWGRTSCLLEFCFRCFFKQFFVAPYLKSFSQSQGFFFFSLYVGKWYSEIEGKQFQKIPWLRATVPVHLCSWENCLLISSCLF